MDNFDWAGSLPDPAQSPFSTQYVSFVAGEDPVLLSALNQKKEAEQKARELFLSFLTPAQKEQLHQSGAITVVGSEGGVYTMETDYYTQNIFSGDRAYCVVVDRDDIPLYDHLLSQLLLIQCDEKYFLEKSVKWLPNEEYGYVMETMEVREQT